MYYSIYLPSTFPDAELSAGLPKQTHPKNCSMYRILQLAFFTNTQTWKHITPTLHRLNFII
uniref:Uncharacterized protein n=1 Tax=Anguilla anguilla TaxID=7936 RepID=A0A0E9RC55_ANGAN